jgi:Fe-Mn family superoxide dismutase
MSQNELSVNDVTPAMLDVSRRDFIKQSAIAATSVLASGVLLNGLAQAAAPSGGHKPLPHHKTITEGIALLEKTAQLPLVAKNFETLLGGHVMGLSDNQLKQHFKLYEGYVKKTNDIHQKLGELTPADWSASAASYSTYRELITELSFTHNGVVLHELYFGNLTHQGEPGEGLKKLVASSGYASWETFIAQLIAAGKAMRGWVIVGLNHRTAKLELFGLDSHHMGMPALISPLLVLDVFEHAYMIDFGIDRAKYLEAFVQTIDWGVVDQRLLYAVHHTMTGVSASE